MQKSKGLGNRKRFTYPGLDIENVHLLHGRNLPEASEEKNRKNLKSVTTGKTCKLLSISYHGFGSGLQRFERSKQQQPEGANQRQHTDKRGDESQRKLGQEADIGK